MRTATHTPALKQAARFLMQATLGATMKDIRTVAEIGCEAWIDEQFAIEPSVTFKEVHEYRLRGLHYEMHHAWWRQVLTANDLLRQRMAVALSEFFVVSEVAIEFVPWEMMQYYDNLGILSFGNWRDLLRHVALDPLMGFYLTHLRNRKPDPSVGRYPDENFAREVMQLFSIGLWELNADGTHRLDDQGREIPTYDNSHVTSFARVFTGLAFGYKDSDIDNPQHFFDGLFDYGSPMKMWENEHDQDEKILLRGARLPAFSEAPGRKAMDDVEDAIDNLFYHPNVGPFFGRFVIQRLVTSNPSPGYIRRVTSAFDDNGQGARGDMRAVIKAVLLDEEAQNADTSSATTGRLREPYLRYVRLARTFNARSEAGTFKINDHDTQTATNQILLNSPSVFNFFLPDYQPPGEIARAGLCAPEFQIMTSSTAITALNHYMKMIGDGAESMRLDFSDEIVLADDPEALIDLLDLKMTCGLLASKTREVLLTAYRELPPAYTPTQKVKAIAQLIAVSPDFAVFL